MFEYISIGVVGMGLYLFFYVLRKSFFRHNKYYNLFIHSASLVFFTILFYGVIRESSKSLDFFSGLLGFLLVYFIYNIAREIIYLAGRRG